MCPSTRHAGTSKPNGPGFLGGAPPPPPDRFTRRPSRRFFSFLPARANLPGGPHRKLRERGLLATKITPVDPLGDPHAAIPATGWSVLVQGALAPPARA